MVGTQDKTREKRKEGCCPGVMEGRNPEKGQTEEETNKEAESALHTKAIRVIKCVLHVHSSVSACILSNNQDTFI